MLNISKHLEKSKKPPIFAVFKKKKQTMKQKRIEIYGFGKVFLDPYNGVYNVSDEMGNNLGEIDPSEVDDWDDDDENIMASIIEDMIDNGELDTPNINEDDYGDE